MRPERAHKGRNSIKFYLNVIKILTHRFDGEWRTRSCVRCAHIRAGSSSNIRCGRPLKFIFNHFISYHDANGEREIDKGTHSQHHFPYRTHAFP